MANIFFSRFFSSGNSGSTNRDAPVSSEYPWLDMDAKYGQGFRLSRHYADECYGYGCMPDITAHMTIPSSLVEKVRQRHSWIAILDTCIDRYGSAQKNLTEEFVDCTGFSDTCWWVSISDPAKWLDDMQSTLMQLAAELSEN